MHTRNPDIASVSRSLMDAAVDPSLWDQAMEDIALYGNAAGATLLPIRGRAPGVPSTQSLKEGLHIYFRDGWHQRDERERGLSILRSKGIFVDQDFASREELRKSDYYRGFLAPFQANWSAGIGVQIGGDEWCLMLERGDRLGAFETSDQKHLRWLAAPLHQAALLSKSFAFGKVLGLSEAFDLLGHASILVDRNGKVLRCNKQAENYIGERLALTRGELSCFKADETTALRKMIHNLCFETAEDPATAPQRIIVTGKSSRPIVIQGVLLKGSASDMFGAAHVLLLLTDPFREQVQTPVDDIRRILGLSNAEATLVALLDTNVSLPQAAEQLGISHETARTQLKSAFQRTGTKRQSELLRLVQRLAMRLRP